MLHVIVAVLIKHTIQLEMENLLENVPLQTKSFVNMKKKTLAKFTGN